MFCLKSAARNGTIDSTFMHIRIRKADFKDIKTLQKLNYEVFIDNHKYDDDLILDWSLTEKGRVYFSKLLSNIHAVCFIAEDEGNAVGYIAAKPKDLSYKKSKYLEIENMGTIPAYRSKVIGTVLVKKIKEWGKERGYDRLYVNAYFKNTGAIKFYKRNGLQETDISFEERI